jgi:uncharacterized protein (TIGR03790 family)
MKCPAAIGLALALWFVSATPAQTIPMAERVLVLVNDRMPAEAGTEGTAAGIFVARYYAAKRGIPVHNLVHVHTSTDEAISYQDYQEQIETPVRKFLDANNGAMRKKILYIVSVYGVPLKTTTGHQTLALDSMLAAMYATPPAAIRFANPYAAGIGSRPPHFDAWADQREAAGLWKIFLVSRLDGPSAVIAQGLVDKAIAAEPSLSPGSGSGYFDYQGTRAPSEPLYPFDQDMLHAAKLSQNHGFATVLHTQHEAACGARIHPGSAYYYDAATTSVYVASYGAETTTTRPFPPIEEGDVVVGMHGTVNDTGNFAYITLGTADPKTFIRLTYPLSPFTEYRATDQIVLEKSSAGAIVKVTAPIDKSMQDVLQGVKEFRFHVQNGAVTVFRNSEPLLSLTDPNALPMNLSSLSIGSRCWDYVLTGIQVIKKDGPALLSDHFLNNTTANYRWELAPLEGQNALWVWGWYGPAYDAYRFVPGAIGAQLTSYTAGTLRNLVNPDPAVRNVADRRWGGNWVPRMLEEGVTGTWGAVEEPYARFYTGGADFFDHFWAGYNFGESYYLAESVLRWTMVAVGDPLYAPAMFQKTVAPSGAQ